MTFTCAQCGKSFKSFPSSNPTFCSRKCFYDHRRKFKPTLIKTCEYCGSEFRTQREVQRFCDRDCANKSRSKKVGDKVGDKKSVTKPATKPVTKPNPRTCATCKYCKRAFGYTSDHAPGYKCFECSNPGSVYYCAFLNMDENGINTRKITWPGCDKWRSMKVTA